MRLKKFRVSFEVTIDLDALGGDDLTINALEDAVAELVADVWDGVCDRDVNVFTDSIDFHARKTG